MILENDPFASVPFASQALELDEQVVSVPRPSKSPDVKKIGGWILLGLLFLFLTRKARRFSKKFKSWSFR